MRDLIFSMAGTVVLRALLVASAVLGPSVAGHTLEEEDARVWITHLLLLLMLQTIQNTREARTVCYNNKNCYI